jgi:hypothetical protein
MQRLFVSLILCFSAWQVHSKVLYVDGSNGDDSINYDNNSASTPWQSLGRAVWGSHSNTSANRAEAARAGDTVMVAAGVYNTNSATDARYIPIYNPANSGTEDAPITFVGNGRVELRSNQSTGRQPILGTHDRSHIVWDGFIINEEYVPTRADTGPVVVWESNNVTLQNLHVIGQIQNWGDNHNGIRLEYTDNIVLKNNRVEGFRESHGSCITTYRTGQLLIENNELSDADDAIFIKGVNDGPVTIRNNLVTDTKNGIMFGGIGLSGQMSYVYQNVVLNSSLGGIIFIGYDSITPAHVTVANNTIDSAALNSDGGGILLRPEYRGYRDLIFKNNIVTNSSAGVTIWSTDFNNNTNATNFSHNNYYNNSRVASIGYQDYSLNGWSSTFNKDNDGTTTIDPNYRSAGDFRLSTDSELINAGEDILDLDNDGSTTDPITMGAYITGDEVIGRTNETPPKDASEDTPPSAPFLF